MRSPWGFGRHRLDVSEPPPSGLVAALHAAYAKLAECQATAGATDGGSQLALPGTAGRTLAQACEGYVAERKYRGTAGQWVVSSVELVRKEVGSMSLVECSTKGGADRLLRWRDEVRASGRGPHAMKDRLQAFALVWRWAAAAPRQWVTLMPVLPSWKVDETERIRAPAMKWVDESTFREVRKHIFDNDTARRSIWAELRRAGEPCDAAAVRAYIARRKLYLSFAFYTGMRREDLNAVDDSYLSVDFGCYWRWGRKTGAEVAAEAICAPFAQDIRAEVARLGRNFRAGELICGGPWWHGHRVLGTAAKAVGVSTFNLMDCRRSFVYHKAMAGVPEAKLVNLMGHADSKMIHAVYLCLQPRLQRDEAGAAWPAALSSVPGEGDGRVLRFPGR